ncbi:hypothetical protein D3C86_2012210 [compost metagenome]
MALYRVVLAVFAAEGEIHQPHRLAVRNSAEQYTGCLDIGRIEHIPGVQRNSGAEQHMRQLLTPDQQGFEHAGDTSLTSLDQS